MKDMIYAPNYGIDQTVTVIVKTTGDTYEQTFVGTSTSFAVHDLLTRVTESGSYTVEIAVKDWDDFPTREEW